MNCIDIISKHKLVPMTAVKNIEDTVNLGKALLNGGLEIIEVPFRTEVAAEAIKILSREFSFMLIGAGTVLSIDQVKRAVDSGAKFIVSPGLNKDVVLYCLKNSIPVVPGALTPTELQLAIELGLEVIKFFPAQQAGGVKYLKAISGPFPQLKFIPTGGINQDNFMEYMALKNVIACGGSWMATAKMIAEKRFDEITSITKNTVEKVQGK
jgi:2-dehydro-3-deoxyphosphogluconate aldolase/(4S)-4-hydroxy-2-oxoglutarate aldolase